METAQKLISLARWLKRKETVEKKFRKKALYELKNKATALEERLEDLCPDKLLRFNLV